MRLRKLEAKDAARIYEWMTDSEINRFFRFDSQSVTMESVGRFIQDAQEAGENLHLAVVNEKDEYLGTISLKSIDREARNAEYAVSMRKETHGTGAAKFATQEILRIAFCELKLHRVYLNVLSENGRANHFYEKMGFVYEGEFKEHLEIRGELKDLKWYRMLEDEFAQLNRAE